MYQYAFCLFLLLVLTPPWLQTGPIGLGEIRPNRLPPTVLQIPDGRRFNEFDSLERNPSVWAKTGREANRKEKSMGRRLDDPDQFP